MAAADYRLIEGTFSRMEPDRGLVKYRAGDVVPALDLATVGIFRDRFQDAAIPWKAPAGQTAPGPLTGRPEAVAHAEGKAAAAERPKSAEGGAVVRPSEAPADGESGADWTGAASPSGVASPSAQAAPARGGKRSRKG